MRVICCGVRVSTNVVRGNGVNSRISYLPDATFSRAAVRRSMTLSTSCTASDNLAEPVSLSRSFCNCKKAILKLSTRLSRMAGKPVLVSS